MKAIRSVHFFLPLLMFAVSSCFNELEDPSVRPADSVISLDISTLAVNGASDPNSFEMENVIKSAFVFIFNDRGVLENPGNTYVTEKTSNGEVIDNGKTLNAKWNVTTGAKEIYVVANAPDDLATTLTDLSSKNGLSSTMLDTLTLRAVLTQIQVCGRYHDDVDNMSSKGMLMTGKASAAAVSGSSTTVPVTVTRKFSRVEYSMRKAKDLEGSEVVVKHIVLRGIGVVTALFKDYDKKLSYSYGKALSKTIDKQQSVAGQASTNPSDYTPLRSAYTYSTKYKKGDPLATIHFSVDGVDKSLDIPATEDITLKGNTVLRVLATLSRGSVDAALDILDWKDAEVNGDIYGNEFKVSKNLLRVADYEPMRRDTLKLSALENIEFLYFEINGQERHDTSFVSRYVEVSGLESFDGTRNSGDVIFTFRSEQTHFGINLWFRSGNIKKRIKLCAGELIFSVPNFNSFSYLGGHGEDVMFSRIEFHSGGDVHIPWSADFYDEEKSAWTSQPPAWLTRFTTSGDGFEYVFADVAAQKLRNRHNEKLKSTPSVGGVYNLANQTNGGPNVENTANCYVVNAPGQYSIPLVYGNAIKNGTNNPSAYHTDADLPVHSSWEFKDFLRHDGQPITTPYIDGAVEASLVWADEERLVAGVGLTGTYPNQKLQFTVPAETIRQGNAMLAVKNAAGEILWSWHIWVTDYSLDQSIKFTYSNGDNYEFMPVNLGWCDPWVYEGREVKVRFRQHVTGREEIITIVQRPYILEGNNSLYNWGRKDPFRALISEDELVIKASDDSDYPNMLLPGIDYSISQWDGQTATRASAYCGISNPTSLLSDRFNMPVNAWNMELSKPVIKTVYDPSPVGYHVAEYDAYAEFNSAGTVQGKRDTQPSSWQLHNNLSNTDLDFPFLYYCYFTKKFRFATAMWTGKERATFYFGTSSYKYYTEKESALCPVRSVRDRD